MHAGALTPRQAASWTSFLNGSVIPAAMEGGYDAVATERMQSAAANPLRFLGVSDDKAKALLEKGLAR